MSTKFHILEEETENKDYHLDDYTRPETRQRCE